MKPDMTLGIKATGHWSDKAVADLSAAMAAMRRRVTVLIVEDNADEAFVLAEMLKGYPCDVETVRDAGSFYQFIADNRKPIDLTFLDIRLNNADGLDLIKTANKAGTILKFIVLTGYPSEEMSLRARELGAVAVFIKPPTTEQMDALFGQISK